MRSMPWSKTLPHFDEAPVQRASFPSTVSSTMKMKPDSDAQPVLAAPEQIEGEQRTGPRRSAVTILGDRPASAAQRVR